MGSARGDMRRSLLPPVSFLAIPVQDTEITRRQVLWLAVLCEGGLAALAGLLGWLTGHLPWETLSWRPRGALLGAALSLPMLLVFLLMIRWPVGPLARI